MSHGLTCRTCRGNKTIANPQYICGGIINRPERLSCPECGGHGKVYIDAKTNRNFSEVRQMSNGNTGGRDWTAIIAAIAAAIVTIITAWNSFQTHEARKENNENSKAIQEVREDTKATKAAMKHAGFVMPKE